MENLDFKWIVVLILGMTVLIAIIVALFKSSKGKVNTEIKHGKSGFKLSTDNTPIAEKTKINEIDFKGDNANLEQDLNNKDTDYSKKHNVIKFTGDNNTIKQDKGNK